MNDSEIEMSVINKAERDAEKYLSKDIDDVAFIFKKVIARRLNIGLWDKYFENLNIYQLAFEAYYYIKEELLNRPKTEDDFVEQVMNELENEDLQLPPGFEDLKDLMGNKIEKN